MADSNGRKRKYELEMGDGIDRTYIRWMAYEKMKLLECIKKHGLNIDKLLQEFRVKSRAEIEFKIAGFTAEGIKSFKTVTTGATAPIETWQKRALKNVFYQPDYSKSLKKVFGEAARNSQHPAIYKLFCELMDGRPPPDCNQKDSIILLQLIEDLAAVIKRLKLAKVKDLIAEGGLGCKLQSTPDVEMEDTDEERSPCDVILNPLNMPKPLMEAIFVEAAKALKIVLDKRLLRNMSVDCI